MASLIVACLASGALLASAAPPPVAQLEPDQRLAVSGDNDIPSATPNANWVSSGHTCLYMTTDYDWEGTGANLCSPAGTCSNEVPHGRIRSATPEEGVSCYLYTDTDCGGYSSSPLTFPGFADLRDINFDKKAHSWRCHRLVPRDAAPQASPTAQYSGMPKEIQDLIKAGVSEFEHVQQDSPKTQGSVIVGRDTDDTDVLRNPRAAFDKAISSASDHFSKSTESAHSRYDQSTLSASMLCKASSAEAWTLYHDATDEALTSFSKATAKAISKYGHFGPHTSVHSLSRGAHPHQTTPPATGATPVVHAVPAWSHFTTLGQSQIDAILPAITQAPDATGTAWVFADISYTDPVNEDHPSSFSFSAVTTVANTQPKNLLPACRHMMKSNQTFEHFMGVLISERMAQEAQNKALNVSFPSQPMTAPQDALLHACESKAMSNVCFEALMQPSKMDQVIQAALLAFNQAADHSLDNAWEGTTHNVHVHDIFEGSKTLVHALLSATGSTSAVRSSANVHRLLSSVKPTITHHVQVTSSATRTVTRNGTVTQHVLGSSGTHGHNVTHHMHTIAVRPRPSGDVLAHCQSLTASDHVFKEELDRVNFARMEYAAWSALLGSDSQGLPELAHVAEMAYQEHKSQIAAMMEPLYSSAMKNSLAWECSDVMMHLNSDSGFTGVEERLYHLLIAFGSFDTPGLQTYPSATFSPARTLVTVSARGIPARPMTAVDADEWKDCRSQQDPKGEYIKTMLAMQNATIEGNAWLKVMQGDLAANPKLNDTITRSSLDASAVISQLQSELDGAAVDEEMSACLQESSARYDEWAKKHGKPSFDDMESTKMELAAETRAKELERQLLALLPRIKITLDDSRSNSTKRSVTARDAAHPKGPRTTCTETYSGTVNNGPAVFTAEHECAALLSIHPIITGAFHYPYPARGHQQSKCDCGKCRRAAALAQRDAALITDAPSAALGKVSMTSSKSSTPCKSTYTSVVNLHDTATYVMDVACHDAPDWMDVIEPGLTDSSTSTSIHPLITAAASPRHTSVTSTTTATTVTVTPTHNLRPVLTNIDVEPKSELMPDDYDGDDDIIDSEISNDLGDCDLSAGSPGSVWWWPYSKGCSSETSKAPTSSTSIRPLVIATRAVRDVVHRSKTTSHGSHTTDTETPAATDSSWDLPYWMSPPPRPGV